MANGVGDPIVGTPGITYLLSNALEVEQKGTSIGAQNGVLQTLKRVENFPGNALRFSRIKQHGDHPDPVN